MERTALQSKRAKPSCGVWTVERSGLVPIRAVPEPFFQLALARHAVPRWSKVTARQHCIPLAAGLQAAGLTLELQSSRH
jgi:hypothetical protein